MPGASELRRHLGRIVHLARAAVEAGALLDGELLAVDVAFDLRARVQDDIGAQNGPIHLTEYAHAVGGDRAVDDGLLADDQLGAVQVGLDDAVYAQRTFAADGDRLALDRHIVADHGLAGARLRTGDATDNVVTSAGTTVSVFGSCLR